MKVTYIGHSGFLIETENSLFLFDYYQGELPQLSSQKPLYIFSSHRHEDHFNPVIFQLAQKHEHTEYLLSFDIRLTPRNFRKWGMSGCRNERFRNVRAH